MSSDYFLAKRPSLSHSDSIDVSTPATPSSPYITARSNALSSKIGGILSASYADLEIRDALNLLDERGIENTAAARRQLRLDIQKDVIESNGDIIREFGHVAEQLKRIGLSIATLNEGCDEMRRHIAAASQETAPMLEEASDLLSRKQDIEHKQQLLAAFNAHFIMNDDEMASLTSTAEPVNDQFFTLLNRTKKIQADCETLLGTENHRLGQEIMDQTSRNLNNAFQKLYRWIQKEFRSLNLENPQISSSIRRALRVLAERPSLFQNCLEFFAEARESVLSDAFYTALTGTSANGEEDKSIKPIELVAHDPLRYVGDMLAWTHAATVSEREALEVLFISEGDEIAKGIRAGRGNEIWSKYDEEDETPDFDGRKALTDLVDKNVAGVTRLLRQRVEQVIQSHDETIMAYKIANLLKFYRLTFVKLLATESALLKMLETLHESAMRQFRALMQDNISGIQNDPQHLRADLGPPDFLQDSLKQLRAIMKTYETSYTIATSREEEFRPVLSYALEPFMEATRGLPKELESSEHTIFTINCLLAARNVLSAFDFASGRVAELDLAIQGHSVDLVDSQYNFFLENSGTSLLIQALIGIGDKPDDLSKISTLDAFQPQALVEASQTLDDFLPSALMDALENVKRVQSANLARQVTEDAADRFCSEFENLEEKILAADELLEDKEGGEASESPRSLRALFPRTSGELRVLLT